MSIEAVKDNVSRSDVLLTDGLIMQPAVSRKLNADLVYSVGPSPDTLDTFKIQSINPPGKQPVIGAFNAAVYDLASRDQRLLDFLSEAERQGMSGEHIVNRFYRVVQNEMLLGKIDGFPPEFDNLGKWLPYLETLLNDKQRCENLLKEMHESNTSTTVYQRYAGLTLVAGLLFGDEENRSLLNVVDFGCGGDYVRGMVLGKPFKDLKYDSSPNGVVAKIISNYQNYFGIRHNLSIDVQDVRSGEAREKRFRGMYPTELHTIPTLRAFEQELELAPNGEFWARDILRDPLGESDISYLGQYDLINCSTVFYQIPELMPIILNELSRFLSPRGMIVVQDFADISTSDQNQLQFRKDWGGDRPYGLFVYGKDRRFREVGRWGSGRCMEFYAGTHFDEISQSVVDFSNLSG